MTTPSDTAITLRGTTSLGRTVFVTLSPQDLVDQLQAHTANIPQAVQDALLAGAR